MLEDPYSEEADLSQYKQPTEEAKKTQSEGEQYIMARILKIYSLMKH